MTLYSRKDAELAARLFRPEYIPTDTMSYFNDYLAVNQPPVPVSNIIGAEAYGRQLNKDAAQTVVSNSSGETTIFTYDLAANTLEQEGAIQVRLWGDYKNASGSGKTFTIKVKYGATTMWAATSASIASAATLHPIIIDFVLSAANSVTAQFVHGTVSFGDATAPTTGSGSLAVAGSLFVFSGTAAETSSALKTVAVTWTHASAVDTVVYRCNYALIQKIGH